MPTTKETEQTSSSNPYSDGGEWEALWARLRAANDGKTEVVLSPIHVGVLVGEIGMLLRRSGLDWGTLTMRLYRVCDSCFSTSDPPKPDCPICHGQGNIPVQIDMHKIAGFIAGMTVSAISHEVKRQNDTEAKDDGR